MRQLAERFAARGHRVTVVTSKLRERKACEINGVTIVEFDVSGNLAGKLTGEVEAYRRFVLQCDYDVFLVKAAQQWTLDALLPVLDEMRRPKIFVPCGFSGLYEPAYAEYFRRMPEVMQKFDHLIFYASDYRDINFARDHGQSHFTVVPNGADEREFDVPADPGFRRRHSIGEETFVVLTIGTLTSGQKGHRELAQAFAQADFRGVPALLLLNGNRLARGPSGSLLFRLKAAIAHIRQEGNAVRTAKSVTEELLIRARLHWLWPRGGGRQPIETLVANINRGAPAKRAMLCDLPRAELIQAYLNSDLFVFASNIEYSPLVLYEAAAAGLPFLSVPVGNAIEIARSTSGGTICPAPTDTQGYTRVDPAVLARHIERLAADPLALAALGEGGRRNWAQKFTWEKIAQQYEALFQMMANQAEKS